MSIRASGKRKRTAYTFNNTAQLLRSGHDFFDALEQLIDSAVHGIHFQTYIFSEDETGERIASALIRAARRGVKIFLLMDAYGSNHLSNEFLKRLKREKIEFRFFGRLFRKGKFHIGRRLHRKVIVIDGFASIVTGINISNNYNDLPDDPAWLDFGVLVKGDVSEKLFLICKQSWLKIYFRRLSKKLVEFSSQQTKGIASSVKIRVRQNDWKIRKNLAAKSYYQCIRQSHESLSIVGGYFLPGRKGLRLLRKASDRGVTIKLIIAQRSDVGVMRNAMLYLYDWLLRNKIQIYEYKPANVHGKAIISDKKFVSIGSYDLNALSTYSNIELNLDIDDKNFALNFHNQLTQIMINDCEEITAEKYKGRSAISQRLIRWFSYRIVKSLFVLSVWLAKKEKEEAYQ